MLKTEFYEREDMELGRELNINSCTINDDSDCFVIAEIGHNHQGKLETALEMLRVAKECGVNAVKLQKRDNKSLFTKDFYDAPYDNENSYGPTYGLHREALEFNMQEYKELTSYARELDLMMFATAFDFKSADFLADFDMPLYKIASADLTNTLLMEHVAKIGKPMVVSTGGGTLDDIKRAYDTIMPHNKNLSFLQCTAAYPIEDYRDMNLQVISTLREEFPELVIGLSDHESGISMSLVAYMLGARIIEKHFTLNRAWHGTDHAFSLSPSGLRRLVRNLKRARVALGDGQKSRIACEEKPLSKMSKKLVVARDLAKGHVLTRDDVTVKSPGDGMAPYEIDKVLNKTLKREVKEDESISLEIVE